MNGTDASASSPGPIAFLIAQTAPLEAGSVSVDPSGTILRRDRREPVQFGFQFAGRLFSAEVRPDEGQLRVTFEAPLGVLPYSAENGAMRGHLLRVLRGLGGTGLVWRLGPRQEIIVGGRTQMETPATAPRIVASLVTGLLPVRAYFDLFDEILGAPAAEAPAE